MTQCHPPHRPTVLILLDGFGYQDSPVFNAIAAAHAPHYRDWWEHAPHLLIETSGASVGLPDGQMGNSEVGHMHIGAGRIIKQDLTRIDDAIAKHTLATLPALTQALAKTRAAKGRIHVMGLLSPGGVHSHENHFFEMADILQTADLPTYFHLFLDGRDTPPRSAATSITALSAHLHGRTAQIATLCGRFYAMDRDNRWGRTQAAYTLLTQGTAQYHAPSALAALEAGYERGEDDEFLSPTVIESVDHPTINTNDCVIFMNFRADRARQLSHAFLDRDFTRFLRPNPPVLSAFLSLTSYAATLPTTPLFPAVDITDSLGEIIAAHDLKQLRIAETEKYAHVTFFFNGGRETPFPGEDRILIPSPSVKTYNLQPEMSAPLITEKLVTAIKEQQYDLIICNFANADMVGHTGDYAATIAAINCLDRCLADVVAATREVGGEVIITADHGNAEKMFDETTGQPHTAHTNTPVPFIFIGDNATLTQENGSLIDIAPTILSLMGIDIPPVMTGKPLVKRS